MKYNQAESRLTPLIKRSLVIEFDQGYRLFSPFLQKWIIAELTDVTVEGEVSLEEWLEDYQKRFVEKAYDRTRDVVAKINPKYWEIVGKWLLDSKNREQVAELFSWLFQVIG